MPPTEDVSAEREKHTQRAIEALWKEVIRLRDRVDALANRLPPWAVVLMNALSVVVGALITGLVMALVAG